MSMNEWAKNEIELAKKQEEKNAPDGEWDYGCACYDSAFKAFQSLCEGGHSGMSIGFTKNILNRLIDGKPLTPIEDTEDVWNLCDYGENHEYTQYQCKENRLRVILSNYAKCWEWNWSGLRKRRMIMKENKFRGFDPITKKFIYGNLLFTNETYYIIPFLTNGCMSQKEMMLRWISPCYQVVSETVGQFAGVHDKNGVEIYENDVVKVISSNLLGNPIYKDNITVTEIADFGLMYALNHANELEVIGNIHERSEDNDK